LNQKKKQVSYHESVISNTPDKIYEIFDIQAAHKYDERQYCLNLSYKTQGWKNMNSMISS